MRAAPLALALYALLPAGAGATNPHAYCQGMSARDGHGGHASWLERRLSEFSRVQSLTHRTEQRQGKQSNSATSFLIESSGGPQWFTCAHCVMDTPSGDPCKGGPLPDPKTLKPALVSAKQGGGAVRRPGVLVAAAYDPRADLAWGPAQQSGVVGLTVAAEFRPLSQHPVIIGGYPDAKGGKFTVVHCRFKGYSELETSRFPGIELDCAGLDYDIAGMSGGPAVDGCTGEVIGVVVEQNVFPARCRDRGSPRVVRVSPIHRQAGGAVAYGHSR